MPLLSSKITAGAVPLVAICTETDNRARYFPYVGETGRFAGVVVRASARRGARRPEERQK